MTEDSKKSAAFQQGQEDGAAGKTCQFSKMPTRDEMTAYVYGWRTASGKEITVSWLDK